MVDARQERNGRALGCVVCRTSNSLSLTLKTCCALFRYLNQARSALLCIRDADVPIRAGPIVWHILQTFQGAQNQLRKLPSRPAQDHMQLGSLTVRIGPHPCKALAGCACSMLAALRLDNHGRPVGASCSSYVCPSCTNLLRHFTAVTVLYTQPVLNLMRVHVYRCCLVRPCRAVTSFSPSWRQP